MKSLFKIVWSFLWIKHRTQLDTFNWLPLMHYQQSSYKYFSDIHWVYSNNSATGADHHIHS